MDWLWWMQADAVVQFLSYEGTFTAATDRPAWHDQRPTLGFRKASTSTVGDSLQLTGTGTAYGDFTWADQFPIPLARSTPASTLAVGRSRQIPRAQARLTPTVVKASDTSLLTVAVTPGENPTSTALAVSCDLSAIGGSTTQTFFDDGSNGDITAGDNTFSYLATVDPSTSDGDKTLDCTISDAEARSGSASIALNVYVILPIGTVKVCRQQRRRRYLCLALCWTDSGHPGRDLRERLSRTSSGSAQLQGFFMQNTAATADGDPNSSDGIYVYIGYYSTLRIQGGGYYAPQVGDEVILRGPISEYYNMTELGNPYLLSVVRSGVDLNAEVPAFDANPPADLADANRYWERLAGHARPGPGRTVSCSEGATSLPARPTPRSGWHSPDSIIAQRSDPYARRAFRDAHPLDDNYDPNNWDGNGYRILMGSLGIKAAAGDNTGADRPGAHL